MRYLFFIVTVMFAFSSCTPLRVVRLEPTVETQEYDYGAKVVRTASADAEIVVSYYDASPAYLVFNLAIENKGSTALTFDPVSCQLIPDIGAAAFAIDPEMQLLSMDIESMQRTRRSRALTWVGVGLAVTGVALDATNALGAAEGVASGNFTEQLAVNAADAIVFSVANANNAANARIAAPPQDIPVPENRFFWLDHSLRVTTIQPGEVAFGKVVFPRNDQASLFNFSIDIDGGTIEVPFRQTVFR